MVDTSKRPPIQTDIMSQNRALWVQVCVGPDENPSYFDAWSTILTRESNVLKQLIRNTPIHNDPVVVRLDVARESFRIFLMWANTEDGDLDVPIIAKNNGNIVWRDLIDLFHLAENLEAWSFHNHILRALHWELRLGETVGPTMQETRLLREKTSMNSMLWKLITDAVSGGGLANVQVYLVREERMPSTETTPARGNRTNANFTRAPGGRTPPPNSGRQNKKSSGTDDQDCNNQKASSKKLKTQTRGTQTGDTTNDPKTKDKGKNNQNNQNNQNAQNAQNTQRADPQTPHTPRTNNQPTNPQTPNQQISDTQQSNPQTPNFSRTNPEPWNIQSTSSPRANIQVHIQTANIHISSSPRTPPTPQWRTVGYERSPPMTPQGRTPQRPVMVRSPNSNNPDCLGVIFGDCCCI
jgi:hypothetical protein